MACVQPISGATVSHFYIEEATCGVTPTSPTWIPLPFTSGNPQLARETLQSNILDGGRDTPLPRLGAKQLGGEIGLELASSRYDDLLEAALGGTWVTRAGDTALSVTVAAAAKTFTRAAGDFTAAPLNIVIGDLIKFPDLLLGTVTGGLIGNARAFRVTAVTATVITCAGIAAGVLADEVTVTTDISVGDTLSIGNTRRFFSVLSNYPTADGTNNYQLSTGVEFTGFTFDSAVNAIVTGSGPILGRDLQLLGATAPSGSTFGTATTNESFSATDARILQDGAIIGFFSSLTITNDNAQSGQFAIGSEGVAFTEKGRAANTVSVSTFFTDNTLLNAFLNESIVQLTQIMENPDGALMFDMPTVKYTSGAPAVDGPTTVTQNLEASAGGSVTESSLVIYRI